MFGINIVPQGSAVVVERLGKFHRVLESGVNYVVPIIETKRKMYIAAYQVGIDGISRVVSKLSDQIDLREQVFDFPKQSVITSDNVSMEIDAVLYYQIVSPEKAVYGISNVVDGIQKLVQTSLRNVVGQMTLDETLSSRENINDTLRVILDEATDAWGVKVTRIELQEITPSKEIRQRMELQMTAEREKRAKILTAEGEKQSAVLKSEGESIAKIKRAEADKQSRILEAEGIGEARLTIAESEISSARGSRKGCWQRTCQGLLTAAEIFRIAASHREWASNQGVHALRSGKYVGEHWWNQGAFWAIRIIGKPMIHSS